MAKGAQTNLDDLAGVVARILDMIEILLEAAGALTDQAKAEIDLLNQITYSCVSQKTRDQIDATQNPIPWTEPLRRE